MAFKITRANGPLSELLEAASALAGPTNRLPTLAQLAASRNLHELRRAWKPVGETRDRLIEEHGEKKNGVPQIRSDMPGWEAFNTESEKLLKEEQEVTLHAIPWTEIEKGYSRDPDTGRRGLLDLSADHMGRLIDAGIITGVPTEDEKKPEEE